MLSSISDNFESKSRAEEGPMRASATQILSTARHYGKDSRNAAADRVIGACKAISHHGKGPPAASASRGARQRARRTAQKKLDVTQRVLVRRRWGGRWRRVRSGMPSLTRSTASKRRVSILRSFGAVESGCEYLGRNHLISPCCAADELLPTSTTSVFATWREAGARWISRVAQTATILCSRWATASSGFTLDRG